MDFGTKHESGLSYRDFVTQYGTNEHQQRWQAVYERVSLSPAQQNLLKSFQREMKVLVLAGTWCGDCVNQCPIFAHFEAANALLRIRYFDRDGNPDLGNRLMTCGAPRVPAVLFLSEDNFVCGQYGDRTLAKYRDLAANQLGPACPTGIDEPADLLAQVTQEWLNEFERIQLMLRLSGRLRQLHGD